MPSDNNRIKCSVIQLWHKRKTTLGVDQAGQTNNSCCFPCITHCTVIADQRLLALDETVLLQSVDIMCYATLYTHDFYSATLMYMLLFFLQEISSRDTVLL